MINNNDLKQNKLWLNKKPEVVITLLLTMIFIINIFLSPYFLNQDFLIREILLYIELGIIAITMTPLIISGNLDLSVASIMVMTSGISAYIHVKLSIPMIYSIIMALILGGIAGGINGLMIAYIGLPWVTVTLGTMALYRGIAQILLGVFSIQDFPTWFVGIDKINIPYTTIPVTFLFFIIIALAFSFMLNRTVFGRWIFALGTNQTAAYFAGVPVKLVKFMVFLISGIMSSIAGIMMVSRLAVARYDLAQGYELLAITATVLGGTSIYGGRGTIYGTVIAVLTIGLLRTGMGVANVKAESQLTVLGILLIISVLSTNLLSRYRKK